MISWDNKGGGQVGMQGWRLAGKTRMFLKVDGQRKVEGGFNCCYSCTKIYIAVLNIWAIKNFSNVFYVKNDLWIIN